MLRMVLTWVLQIIICLSISNDIYQISILEVTVMPKCGPIWLWQYSLRMVFMCPYVSIHQSWLAKELGLGLGLLCWGFKGVQEAIKEAVAKSLTCAHKRTSIGPSRSCWNGTTSALELKEITLKGTWVSCVFYQ